MYTFVGTYNDSKINVIDPCVEEVNIEAITHALSQNCRYNGHTKFNWTVAQHSLMVADMIRAGTGDKNSSPLAVLLGLMHDASEGYLSDVVTPYKQRMSQYKDIECKIQNLILRAVGINPDNIPQEAWDAVGYADYLCVGVEVPVLLGTGVIWKDIYDLENPEISPWKKHISMSNPKYIQGKMLLEIAKAMEDCGLLSSSVLFKSLGLDWYYVCKYREASIVPIFNLGRCICYVIDNSPKHFSITDYKGVNLVAMVEKEKFHSMQSFDMRTLRLLKETAK